MKISRIHRRAFWSLFCVSLTAIVAYLSLVAFSTHDTLEAEFRSRHEVATAGFIERGIVPGFLPMSASAIHVDANLDGGGVVVKFDYGPDFETFLAAQKQLPGITPSSLGINGHDRNFSNASELIHIPKISWEQDQSSAGYLLINSRKRRAMYVKAPRGTGSAASTAGASPV